MENKPRKYRPSNGSEGVSFCEDFCDQCKFCGWTLDGEPKEPNCDILIRSLTFGIDEPEYPEELTYTDGKGPNCSKFQKWDWTKGDPEPEEIINPNQLSLF